MLNINEAKLYVGTYHKYNCGSIAGEWVTLTNFKDVAEFYAYCAEIHKDEDDPEFMFQDYENLPRSFYSECSIDGNFWEFAAALTEQDIDYETFCAWANHFGSDLTEDAVSNFCASFCGNYDSEKDFAEEIAEENGWFKAMETAGINASYFDIDQFTYDLFDVGEYSFIGGAVYLSN